MQRVMALVLPILLTMIQPAPVNAITDTDEKCINQAYEIGYDLSESIDNIMYALEQLEADCVYSGMMSQEAKCLVWYYDTGIRIAHLFLTSPGSPDLTNYFTESDRLTHECTNLDLLIGRDKPPMDVDMES
jgi:hypothetical protein